MKVFYILVISLIAFYINAKTFGVITGLEIPRFVSLKTDDSNLRIGSGKDYPIKLKYVVHDLPLKVIDEYDVWRKVIDFENNEGWIHKSLIKAERFAIINTPYDEPAQIYKKPEGLVVGKIGKRNIVKIKTCIKNWCLIEINKNKGWIVKANLWGVNNDEHFDISLYQRLINQIWKIKL